MLGWSFLVAMSQAKQSCFDDLSDLGSFISWTKYDHMKWQTGVPNFFKLPLRCFEGLLQLLESTRLNTCTSVVFCKGILRTSPVLLSGNLTITRNAGSYYVWSVKSRTLLRVHWLCDLGIRQFMSVCLNSQSFIDLFSLSFCLSLSFLAIKHWANSWICFVHTASNHRLEFICSIIIKLINNQTRVGL